MGACMTPDIIPAIPAKAKLRVGTIFDFTFTIHQNLREFGFLNKIKCLIYIN